MRLSEYESAETLLAALRTKHSSFPQARPLRDGRFVSHATMMKAPELCGPARCALPSRPLAQREPLSDPEIMENRLHLLSIQRKT